MGIANKLLGQGISGFHLCLAISVLDANFCQRKDSHHSYSVLAACKTSCLEGCNFYSWALVTHGPAQMVTGHFWMLTQWCLCLSSYFFHSLSNCLPRIPLLSFVFSLWNPSFVFKVNFLSYHLLTHHIIYFFSKPHASIAEA